MVTALEEAISLSTTTILEKNIVRFERTYGYGNHHAVSVLAIVGTSCTSNTRGLHTPLDGVVTVGVGGGDKREEV